VQQYPFTDDQAVMQADWELYIQVLGKAMPCSNTSMSSKCTHTK
jgi:hypothetical protein